MNLNPVPISSIFIGLNGFVASDRDLTIRLRSQ